MLGWLKKLGKIDPTQPMLTPNMMYYVPTYLPSTCYDSEKKKIGRYVYIEAYRIEIKKDQTFNINKRKKKRKINK